MQDKLTTWLWFETEAEEAARYYASVFRNTQLGEVTKAPGGGAHRPSMGQDMVKGRRTEIDFLNGFVVAKGKEIGLATPANAALADIVRHVERGDLPPDPKHIHDLRLN